MKIAEIGNVFETTEKIDYLSNQSFLEYDCLIISIPTLIRYLNSYVFPKFTKRRANLEEFLKHKNVPLIVFSPTENKHYNDGEIYDYKSYLPIGDFVVESEHSKSFEVVPRTIFSDFFEKYKNQFQYDSFFSKKDGINIAQSEHTKKTIAFYNSSVIFIPTLRQKFKLKTDESYFLSELFEIAKKAKKGDEGKELPEWANNYFLPGEKEIQIEKRKIRDEILKLESRFIVQTDLLEKYERYKRLFTESGNNLEIAIENIFKELGFEILEVEAGRDDLILKFKDKISVVEIKGTTGSAAEKYAAQLEKWVANYYETNEIKPKGILLVNAFRDLELDKRKDEVFPNQMLKYSIQREHCLLSTIQLLGLYYFILNNPDQKEELLIQLLETNGVYERFQKWDEFIGIG